MIQPLKLVNAVLPYFELNKLIYFESTPGFSLAERGVEGVAKKEVKKWVYQYLSSPSFVETFS